METIVKEKILLFQCADAMKIRNIAAMQGIETEEIPLPRWNEKLGQLAGLFPREGASLFMGKTPGKSLMVFCALGEGKLDQMLSELRKNKISVDYKAILTPVNMQWNVMQLYFEMEMERQAILKNKK